MLPRVIGTDYDVWVGTAADVTEPYVALSMSRTARHTLRTWWIDRVVTSCNASDLSHKFCPMVSAL